MLPVGQGSPASLHTQEIGKVATAHKNIISAAMLLAFSGVQGLHLGYMCKVINEKMNEKMPAPLRREFGLAKVCTIATSLCLVGNIAANLMVNRMIAQRNLSEVKMRTAIATAVLDAAQEERLSVKAEIASLTQENQQLNVRYAEACKKESLATEKLATITKKHDTVAQLYASALEYSKGLDQQVQELNIRMKQLTEGSLIEKLKLEQEIKQKTENFEKAKLMIEHLNVKLRDVMEQKKDLSKEKEILKKQVHDLQLQFKK